ncbi:MAG: 5-oxoprolinase subunit PxpA [Rhodospirillales bacterium]|jgi:5-oxoprolinase (ATP-hydrolysing) subunit A|nr:5-oxoprolinase subunit PxpA [Rhodospirillales bacterium]
MDVVDLNSDLGESFGAYVIGNDEEMFKIISSANIGCGFHGGDPIVMHKTLSLAKEYGVGAGAHPSFNDLWGFGRRPIMGERPEDIEKSMIYQIAAIQGMAGTLGMRVSHFKTHGSLGNMAAVDADLAMACARAVKAIDRDLLFIVMPGNELEKAGEKLGLRCAREIFADRAYDDDANLVSRKIEGSMIHDPAVAVPRMLKIVEDEEIISVNGKKLPVAIDTICVHGDNPAAVDMARQIRNGLESAGVAVRPMAETLA